MKAAYLYQEIKVKAEQVDELRALLKAEYEPKSA